MTATPKRQDNIDTYSYFGNPIYTYSLAQGIDDGFLAPYRVHRVTTTWDAVGWRPSKGELDRYGGGLSRLWAASRRPHHSTHSTLLQPHGSSWLFRLPISLDREGLRVGTRALGKAGRVGPR